jgi:hypothetical protein
VVEAVPVSVAVPEDVGSDEGVTVSVGVGGSSRVDVGVSDGGGGDSVSVGVGGSGVSVGVSVAVGVRVVSCRRGAAAAGVAAPRGLGSAKDRTTRRWKALAVSLRRRREGFRIDLRRRVESGVCVARWDMDFLPCHAQST